MGMPSGLFLPFFFGMYIRLRGVALYPLRFNFCRVSHLFSGVSINRLSTPGVRFQRLDIPRLIAKSFEARELANNL